MWLMLSYNDLLCWSRPEEEREEDQITEGNFLIPVLNPQVLF